MGLIIGLTLGLGKLCAIGGCLYYKHRKKTTEIISSFERKNFQVIRTRDNTPKNSIICEFSEASFITFQIPEKFETVPQAYICPIHLGIFRDPVIVLPSGHTYDKISIQNQIQDPSTRQIIKNRAPNRALKDSIEIWLKNLTETEIRRNETLRTYIQDWIEGKGPDNLRNDPELRSILNKYENVCR